MTEPKRWDASNCVRFCDGCDAEYGITAGADAGDDACSGCSAADAPHVYPRRADFDRLRDERDRLREAAEGMAAWIRDNCEEGRSALAVFDTLTEENPAPHGAPSAHERGGRA